MGEKARIAHAGPLRRIAATPAARADDESPGERWRPVALPDVAYLFVRSALKPQLIAAPWTRDYRFPPKTVFVRRVAANEIFRTGVRTLHALEARLPPRFVRIHRSLFVNTDVIVELDLGSGSINQIGIYAGGAVEYLPVSRRAARMLRGMFAYPLRARRTRSGQARTM